VKAPPQAALVRAFDDVVGTLCGVERRKRFGDSLRDALDPKLRGR